MRWENVDLQNNSLQICETVVRGKVDGKIVSVAEKKTKTETSNRTLFFSDEIKRYLLYVQQEQIKQKGICGECYRDSDYVCVDKMGEPIKPDYVTHRFGKIIRNNGLKHITFHELHHSTGSYMETKGYSIKQIQELLGHSNYNFTADTYVHVDESAKRAMIDSISQNFRFL